MAKIRRSAGAPGSLARAVFDALHAEWHNENCDPSCLEFNELWDSGQEFTTDDLLLVMDITARHVKKEAVQDRVSSSPYEMPRTYPGPKVTWDPAATTPGFPVEAFQERIMRTFGETKFKYKYEADGSITVDKA